MSRGDLQEMEQSKTAVNSNAKPAEAQQQVSSITPGQTGRIGFWYRIAV